jgi:hypothetical protein
MGKANYSLRLQPSLKAAAERLASAEGASLNQFINVAVAEKLSALETEAYFIRRAAGAGRERFLAFLDEAGDEPPAKGDEPPAR